MSTWITYDALVSRFDGLWKMLGRERENRTELAFKVKNLVKMGMLRSRIRCVEGFDVVDIQTKHDADEYRAAWATEHKDMIRHFDAILNIKKLFDGCDFMEAAHTNNN